MNSHDEEVLRAQLVEDREKRDRSQFDYTIDALENGGIMPLSIWPEPNANVYEVIRGSVDYDKLPIDYVNEHHKGALWAAQQDIILRNGEREPLCEALEMGSCLKEKCPLFDSSLAPPICREYKMAFRK